ncbi:MAG: metalloregulator ArsR/SmtB family transcription factor [Halomonas sp.]|nr:metalloregulator ArsR/SmtB family transcription factor [Halomonas sp.]
MNVIQFYKCLSDINRLTCLCLIHEAGEACVCEIINALHVDQPKASQYLSQLRKCGLLISERRGKWMYYQFSPELPDWARGVIKTTLDNNKSEFEQAFIDFKKNQLSTDTAVGGDQ